MQFEFATAGRIIFGAGTLPRVGPLAAEMGRKAMLVRGRSSQRLNSLCEILADQGLGIHEFSVSGEPTVEQVRAGVQEARRTGCEVVIGFGGGSPLDAAKAIAALLNNPGDPFDYLEVIGQGKPLVHPSAPMIAIPTTAGTGTEVTRNAVLGSPQHKVKVSLRSPHMLPRLALVDPELSYSLPPEITARSGLDALTQLIEPFVSNQANPMTDAICREGMRRAARSLLQAFRQGDDPQARADMALAALMGGLALANAKLGAVHGFAGPLGGMIPAPHGAICARLLPLVMEANLKRIEEEAGYGEYLNRYTEVARILTGDLDATASQGVAWVRDLCATLQVPPLGDYGLAEEDIPALIEMSARSSSMKGNPVKLTLEEMSVILLQAM